MNRCWLLIVTRGLRVWLPPEVYVHQHELALRESNRWRETFRIPIEASEFSRTARGLHLVETMFPEPWRACPIWVGVTWSVASYPRIKAELMPADEQEAVDWLKRHTPRRQGVDAPGQVEFDRRGVQACAGVFRVKRVLGF